MDRKISELVTDALKEQKHRKRWYQVFCVLASIVVFCTTYALILPAITLEHDVACAWEEHIHTEECYDENSALCCGKEEHVHTEECKTQESVLQEPTGTEAAGDVSETGPAGAEEDGKIPEAGPTGGEADGEEPEAGPTDAGADAKADGEEPETGSTGADAKADGEEPEAGPADAETDPAYIYEDDTLVAEVALAEDCVIPEGAVLCVQPIADTDETYDYKTLVWQAEEAAFREAAGIALYDIGFYTSDGEEVPVEAPARVSLHFKESVFSEPMDEVAVLHYQEDADMPVMLEEVDAEQDEKEALSSLTFQTEGFSVFAVMAITDSDQTAQAEDSNSFTLTYNGYTITFYIQDTEGNAISGDYSGSNMAATAATRYLFGAADAGTTDKSSIVENIAPVIEGFTYTGAKYGGNPVCSVATSGYNNGFGTFTNAFQFYVHEPIVNSQWYSRNENSTVTLTYTKGEQENGDSTDFSGTYAIVNKKSSSSGVAMQSANMGSSDNTNRAGLTVALMRSEGTYYVDDSRVTLWTFEKQSDGTYYIYIDEGGTRKYLTIGNSNNAAVTLSSTPQSITITEGSGTYEGMVRLTNSKGIAVNLFGGNAAQGFGSYNDSGANEWQTLAQCLLPESSYISYDINVPSLGSKGTGWKTTPTLDQTIQPLTGATNLFAQPAGYYEETGTAGIENLYRFNVGPVDDLASSPALTKEGSAMKDAWYGEERFEGWTCTLDGVTYLLEPGASVTVLEDGTCQVTAYKTIVTESGQTVETVQALDSPVNLTLSKGTVLTGRWTEVSNVVTFFVNYKGTILDVEGDVTGRRKDTFTLAVAVGHVFYGKLKVGDDQIFGTGANEQITGAFSPDFTESFEKDNPNTQIVIEYLRECTKPSTTGTGYETSMRIEAHGANSAMVESNTLNLLKVTGRTVQISTANGANPTIDNSLCDSEHYQIRWYVMKEQTNTWHIDGVLVAKTAEIAVTKTLSGLSDDKVKGVLGVTNLGATDSDITGNDFYIAAKLGTGDGAQDYIKMFPSSKGRDAASGSYAYVGTASTANIPNSYHWTLRAIADETYTLAEENYDVAGYDVSSIIVHYYTDADGSSQVKYIYGTDTGAFEQAVTGGKTTAVSFNNLYTPEGTGAMAIVKRDSESTANDLYGILQGAEFTLYAADNPDSKAVVTTNANGTAYFNGLEPGEYILRETKAPYGYVENNSTWTVRVEKNNGKITVTIYGNDENGSLNTDGMVLYDSGEGGIRGSYTVFNQAAANTITVTKTFSGLPLAKLDELVAESRIITDEQGNKTPSGYYINFAGNISSAGDVTADGYTNAVLTLDQAQRSQDAMTFTWTIYGLAVTQMVGEEQKPITYTVSERNFMREDYVDTAVTLKVNNEEHPVEMARGDDWAYAGRITFQTDSSNHVALTNHYTNTFALKLQKTDSITKEPLAGAEFKIYGPYSESSNAGDRYTYEDEDGTKHTVYYIQTVTSGPDGYAVIDDLTLSKGENTFAYILNEEKAPDGYAAAAPQVITVTVDDEAISTPDGSNYVAGILEYEAPNTREENFVHRTLDTAKIWEPDSPENGKVTLELYRISHFVRNESLPETVDAVKVASITLDGTVDAVPAGDTDSILTAYESKPWTATWVNLPSANAEQYAETREHYHYFVREVTPMKGYAVSYTCYDANDSVPDGAVQKLRVGDDLIQGVLIADMDEAYTVTITNTAYYELPETGGFGKLPYVTGGALMTAVSLLYGYLLRRRKERRSAQ